MPLAQTAPVTRVCLTGGIATGKSRVGAWFEARGWRLICTDKIVHDLYEPEQSLPSLLAAEFGDQVLSLDGRVNRKALSAVVFKDPGALSRLNKLVHPAVRTIWKRQMDDSISSGGRVMVTIPLAYETQATGEFEMTLVVACSHESQKQRMLERGVPESELEARLLAQMPVQKKIDLADLVVWNNGPWEITEKQLHLISRTLDYKEPIKH